MPNAVEQGSIHHDFTGLAKARMSNETMHDD
jgi:hypothetical protein